MGVISVQVMDELSDRQEQERMELSQLLIQQGKHNQVEEALKELERKHKSQTENKQAELDGELQTEQNHITQMINEESNSTLTAEHRNILDKVRLICYSKYVMYMK